MVGRYCKRFHRKEDYETRLVVCDTNVNQYKDFRGLDLVTTG